VVYSPQTWHDLPVIDTPIIAARLAYMENGIAAADTAAAIAQATADAAAGGGGAGVVPGLALDGATDDGPALQDALDLAGDGGRAAYLHPMGNSDAVCYINSTVQIQDSGLTLDFEGTPIKMGPNGMLRIFGSLKEVPASGKPKLTADAASGATVLHLDNVSYFAAGNLATIRGNRDANGKPLQIFSFTITAVNTGALTITISPGLPEAYLQTNPTTWSNKLSQVTKVVSSFLTGSPDRGDVIVGVVSSADFAVGDFVQVIDDVHTLDDDGPLDVQATNFSHKEQAHVVEIPDGTHLKLSHPLFHTYDVSQRARVQVLNGPTGSTIRNASVTFSGVPADTQMAFECRYGYHSGFSNCHVVGKAGNSWLTQAFRLTDSLACYVDQWTALNPSDVGPGNGYGATFYGSTLCWIRGGYASGCRHSVLGFNGAAGNTAIGNHSVDARISDIDFHGADCVDNLAIANTITGGERNTTDSTVRTAIKIGNPSHVRPGDGRNTAIGNLIANYPGVAFEIIPEAHDNLIKGNVVRGALVGIKAGPLAVSTTLEVGAGFCDNDFYDVPTPWQIDGGTNSVVTRLVLDNNRWTRCGPFVIANAPGARITRDQIVEPATGSGFTLTATGCPDLVVKGNDYSGGGKGVYLSGCPDARVTRNDLHDLTGTVVLGDNGGNTGLLFRANDAHPYTPTRANTGTGPSSSTTVVL
jgi:hypothetical protein